MKHILLLRHAKSSWDDSSLKDFDRPLARRGLNDAPRMGTFAKAAGYNPDLVIASPAERARQTTELFVRSAGMDEEIIIWNEDHYYGSSDDYLESIQQASDSADIIMLVGHNPDMEDIAGRLCGDAGIRMPTAALVCFEHAAKHWEQVEDGTAQLKWMMIPKVLKKIW